MGTARGLQVFCGTVRRGHHAPRQEHPRITQHTKLGSAPRLFAHDETGMGFAPSERLKRFAFFTYFGSIIVGFLMLLTGIVHINGVWFGIEPFLAALLVLFGLSRPNATILLMFIIPIKAAWVAWGSGLLCLLNLLDGRSLSSAMWLAGWLSGYIWLKGGMSGGLKKILLRYKQRRIKQRLSTFDVIDGGKGWGHTPGSDETIH